MIGVLSFGFSHVLPHGAAYGHSHEDDSDSEDDGDHEGEGDDEEPADEESEEEAVEEPEPLSVHFSVDSSEVNPLVRDRYKIYAKVDPDKKDSKRFLFDLESGSKTKGDLKFEIDMNGNKYQLFDGKKLQVYVVKDNYQKDCNPNADMKKFMEKDSTIKKMPKSVSIKLSQPARFLQIKDMKKFSGANATPDCLITDIKFED